MDPQPPPPAAAATYGLPRQHHQHQQHQRHSHSPSNDLAAYEDYTLPPQDPRYHRASRGSQGRSHDSVISHPFSPKPSSAPSPTSSISSVGRKHRSIQEIQNSSPVNVSYPPTAHIDPEKAAASAHRNPSPNGPPTSRPDVTRVVYDSGEYPEGGPEEKCVQLLLFLSGPCALLSFAITLWTFLALFLAILMQPFRLCTNRPPLSAQLTAFLAPPLNLQLRLIYSFSASTDYRPGMLVVVHLFAPVVAVGVAIGAWTAAGFWFFSSILGDPAGQDGHNDGKDSLLGVRNWWDRWLSRALR